MSPDLEVPAVPPAPRAPSARAHALIFRYQGAQKVFVALGLAFSLGGIPFVGAFTWGLPLDVAVDFSAVPVAGVIERVEAAAPARVDDVEVPRFEVAYAYEIDGRSFEGTAVVQGASPGEPGDAVLLEVASAYPRWSRAAGERNAFFGYAGAFSLLFPLTGLGFLFGAVRSNRREIRAFTHGTPAMARVVYAGLDASTQIRGRHPFQLRWEFRVDGSVYRGSISSMDEPALADLALAGQVPVLYDSRNPRINTLWVS